MTRTPSSSKACAVVVGAGARQGKAYLLSKGEDGALKPGAIAEAYWHLHGQDRSAWTHELDLRPCKETF